MARFLFVTPPLSGHVNPTVAFGAELRARGHRVAWAGLPGVVDAMLPSGVEFFGVGGGPGLGWYADMTDRRADARGAAALKFLWEGFIIPVAVAMIDDLNAVVAEFRPDLIVADQQAPGGAVVAGHHGIPWVTSATTSAELADPLRDLPRVDEWVRSQLSELGSTLGDVPGGDLRFSEILTIAFTTSALTGDLDHRHAVRFVGPSITDRPEPVEFPWDWLDPNVPHVLVSLGTLNAAIGARFFDEVTTAVAGAPLQAVIVGPGDAVTDAPNVLIRDRVPQLALLRHIDVVVCHGGHNTVCESLAHGVPLLVAPIRDDQPIIADQVTRAGAGVRVKFGRVRADELRTAIARLLSEPSFRASADNIKRSFANAGGAAAAADAVEDLLAVR